MRLGKSSGGFYEIGWGCHKAEWRGSQKCVSLHFFYIYQCFTVIIGAYQCADIFLQPINLGVHLGVQKKAPGKTQRFSITFQLDILRYSKFNLAPLQTLQQASQLALCCCSSTTQLDIRKCNLGTYPFRKSPRSIQNLTHRSFCPPVHKNKQQLLYTFVVDKKQYIFIVDLL